MSSVSPRGSETKVIDGVYRAVVRHPKTGRECYFDLDRSEWIDVKTGDPIDGNS